MLYLILGLVAMGVVSVTAYCFGLVEGRAIGWHEGRKSERIRRELEEWPAPEEVE